jgi:hypothetical protein
VAESEVLGGCSQVSIDSFSEEFTSAEEEAELRLELRELKQPLAPAEKAAV